MVLCGIARRFWDYSACKFAAIAGESRSPGSDTRSGAAGSASLPSGGELGFGGSTDQGGRGLDRAAEYLLDAQQKRVPIEVTTLTDEG